MKEMEFNINECKIELLVQVISRTYIGRGGADSNLWRQTRDLTFL